jgi:NADPH:quinone reductase-like Zn-dependent oxidoreductase
MNTMTQDRYGSANLMTLDDIEKPAIGDREVLIRVRGAGVGPEVWHTGNSQCPGAKPHPAAVQGPPRVHQPA